MSAPPLLHDRQLASIAKALSDPRRYKMLSEVAASGTLTCQAMRGGHEVSAATISHHLKELEGAGLIEITRQGKYASVRFCADTMAKYLKHLAETLHLSAGAVGSTPP